MKHMRILFIDGDAFYLHILKTACEAHGATTVCASSAEEGIKSARNMAPDVIVTELVLPNKSGLEVLREIRADALLRHIPILILTHVSDREDIENCFADGAQEYLIKTHQTPEEIIGHIKRVYRYHHGA